MAISALGYAASRIEDRDGDVFVGIGSFINPVAPPADDMLYSLGAVTNIKVTGTERQTKADSHNRTYQKGVDLEVTIEVMQTGYAVEFTEIPALVNADSVMLKITDTLVPEAATAEDYSVAAHAASGIEFENVKLRMGFEVDFIGEDSMITLSFSARLTMDQVADLGTSPIVVGGA